MPTKHLSELKVLCIIKKTMWNFHKTTAFFHMYFPEKNVLYSGQYGNSYTQKCLLIRL